MLKFTIIDKNTICELKNSFFAGEYADEAEEIAESFLPLTEEGCEVGIAKVADTLLFRICDGGEYIFVYPIALRDFADEREALENIRTYVVKEEIPLVFCDIPKEAVATFEEAFRFTEIRDDGESLFAFVKSELLLLDEMPKAHDGVISLTPLTEEDIPVYAEISKNEELNRYWGYDYREDIEDPPDEYFYLAAERGFQDGTSLTLGVRYDGKLIGEAILWGFDLIGGCEVAFRILPEFQGHGLGKRTLRLLMKIGEEIGLINLYGTVRKENLRSVGLLDGLMERCAEKEYGYKYIYRY